MKTIFLLVGITLLTTASAFAGDGASQSSKSKAIETDKLAALLNGKSIHCLNAKGQETFSLRVLSKDGKNTLQAASSYGDADIDDDSTEVHQLSVGELVMVVVSGPDSDEGEAAVLIPSDYLDRDGETYANAQIFDAGTGDSSDKSEPLKCSLK